MIPVAAALLGACGDGEAAAPESTPAPTPPSTKLIVVAAPTTTIAPVDPELIQDCVDYVQFGVYTGNGLAEQMWDNASRNLQLLVLDCEALGRSDMAGLRELSRQWQDIEAYLTAATAPIPED